MLGVKEIKSILRENSIRPSKRLGQNFLIDENVQKKIIDAVGLRREDVVLEVGPGLGALTQELCRRAKKVIAIEKDRRLHGFLLKNNTSGNLELVQGDILDWDFHDCPACQGAKIKIVGNPPYYISSPILVRLLKNRTFINTIFITVQKEFAERLVAAPGTRAYGAISCFAQFYAEPEFLFTIRKTVFYPAPKVDSCFLKIRVRDEGLYLTDEEKLFKIIRQCFEKRRKTILNSLRMKEGLGAREEILQALDRAGISPSRRPETMSLKEFVTLSDHIKTRGGS